MPITKDAGEIGKWGGGVVKVLLVNDDGPAGSEVAGDWLELGHVAAGGKVTDDTPFEERKDETGGTVQVTEGERAVTKTLNLMQSGADVWTFLKDTVRGKFFALYHNMGTINGKTQEMIVGICRIKPMIDFEIGVKEFPVEITILENKTAIGFGGTSEADLPTGAKASTVTIPVSGYYQVVDTAV